MVWLSDLLVYTASYGSGIALIATGASNLHHSSGVNVGLICAGVLSICLLPFVLDAVASMGACAMSKVGRGYRSPLWDEARRLNEDITKVPVLYSEHYNITAFGLEKLHPFDSVKYGRVYNALCDGGLLSKERVMTPSSVPSHRDLLVVHSPSYLAKLHSSFYLTKILEVPVFMLPSPFLRNRVLEPMLYGTSGSIIGAQVACNRGWAINLSGGYHHAHGCGGSGFCVYADITLAIQHLRLASASPSSSSSASLTTNKGAGDHAKARRPSSGRRTEPVERRQEDKRSSWVYHDDDGEEEQQAEPLGAISVKIDGDDGGDSSVPSSPLSPSSSSWTFSSSSTPTSYQTSQQGAWEGQAEKHREDEKERKKETEQGKAQFQPHHVKQGTPRGGKVKKVMIVDVDAHQGNGHERDFIDDEDVYILDVYNPHIFPHDVYAKRGISREVLVDGRTADDDYLRMLGDNLNQAIQEFQPDFLVYNAGTDCMANDPLGSMSLSDQAIIRRDELVFEHCLSRGLPLLMLLSGGYQRSTAPVIARSIVNLHQRFGLLK